MWIVVAVLGALLVPVLLLCVPVDLKFDIEREDRFRSRVRLVWMFGLISKDLGHGPRKERRKERKRKKRNWKRYVKLFVALVRSRGFVKRCIRLLQDLRQRVHIRELDVEMELGLGDPAATALVYAAISPGILFADRFSPVNIRVYPDFDEARLKGRFKGDLRVVPIRLAKPILLFLFSPATLRGIRSAVRVYRK